MPNNIPIFDALRARYENNIKKAILPNQKLIPGVYSDHFNRTGEILEVPVGSGFLTKKRSIGSILSDQEDQISVATIRSDVYECARYIRQEDKALSDIAMMESLQDRISTAIGLRMDYEFLNALDSYAITKNADMLAAGQVINETASSGLTVEMLMKALTYFKNKNYSLDGLVLVGPAEMTQQLLKNNPNLQSSLYTNYPHPMVTGRLGRFVNNIELMEFGSSPIEGTRRLTDSAGGVTVESNMVYSGFKADQRFGSSTPRFNAYIFSINPNSRTIGTNICPEINRDFRIGFLEDKRMHIFSMIQHFGTGIIRPEGLVRLSFTNISI